MSESDESWKKKNILKIKESFEIINSQKLSKEKLQDKIEPWLTALFQSEHLSLLAGSGLTTSIYELVNQDNENETSTGMEKMNFSVFEEKIKKMSEQSAKNKNRGEANIEDQIRTVNELIRGLEILCLDGNDSELNEEEDDICGNLENLKNELHRGIKTFVKKILKNEKVIMSADNTKPASYLIDFLMSLGNRPATKDRLNIFTTNYDRVIEYGSELAGMHLLDRFVGNIFPIFRSSRLNIDMHYNPPGIRGEPRYLEGVAYFTKLHGSLDWKSENGNIRRYALPYGTDDLDKYSTSAKNIMIYPNSSKDRETAEYPYIEMFRDFASSICRPNSTVVLYGYGFNDDHINRILKDMLTIPSTHLVIISYRDPGGRIKKFYDKIYRKKQITLLIGGHFGNLEILMDNYMPKPSIDKTTYKMTEILKARGISIKNNDEGENDE